MNRIEAFTCVCGVRSSLLPEPHKNICFGCGADLPTYTTTMDAVKHPKHYTGGSIEVWDFIVDQGFDYLEGNICKYLCRWKSKNGLEDLLKARAYLDKLISLQEPSSQ